MKKTLALLIALTLTTTLSCGGGGGGGGTGDHYTEAQQIMAGALYAALLAHGAASSGALGDAIEQFEESGTTDGSLNFTITYATAFEGGDDQATITGTDDHTLTGASETGGTLTVSPTVPLDHTSTITSITVPAGGTYAAIEIGSASGDTIAGSLSGSVTIDSTGGGITVTAADVTGSNYDGTDVNVTLTDASAGTITFADWAPTSALSGTTINSTLTSVAATVTYTGETYSCTGGTATLAVPASSASETDTTFTVSTVPTCECTAGC